MPRRRCSRPTSHRGWPGETRAIFTHIMPVRQLPPGKYVLRVRLSAGGADGQGRDATLRGGGAGRADDVRIVKHARPRRVDVYLPVSEDMLSRAFNHRRRVAHGNRAGVPRARAGNGAAGVRQGRAGVQCAAPTRRPKPTFKSAIDPDGDSSAIIAYLAAVFAAAGHDQQAAGAWQTSLIDGSDFPQIYDWLAGSLLRTRDLRTARSMLEEAIAKWPSDVRFARPMALVYATFGQGRRGDALARASSRRAQGRRRTRCSWASSGSTSSTRPARCAHARRGSEAGQELRGRVHEGQGAASARSSSSGLDSWRQEISSRSRQASFFVLPSRAARLPRSRLCPASARRRL